MTPEPIGLLSFLTCELVTHDDNEGRYSAINIFSTIRARKFPARVHNFWLFVEINSGKGWNAVSYRIVHADSPDEGKAVYDRLWLTGIADPLEIATDHLSLGPIEFPRPGVYLVELYQGSTYIASRRITLEQETRPDLMIDRQRPREPDDAR